MRVFVACESSGTVRDAFRARAHDALSCDLLPADEGTSEAHHIVGDALRHIRNVADFQAIDLLIAHPPYTYLSASGLHWNHRTPGRAAKTEEALVFFKAFLDAPVSRIAVENPVGCASTRIRKPDQIIQPWMFGHDASKKTCLWLKNLQKLRPTCIVPPAGWKACPYNDPKISVTTLPPVKVKKIDGYWFSTDDADVASRKPVWANQTPSGQNKLGPSATRWKERSKTYSGIAEAMARQWGGQ